MAGWRWSDPVSYTHLVVVLSNQGNYISIIVSSILSSMLIGAALAIIVPVSYTHLMCIRDSSRGALGSKAGVCVDA